MAIRKASAQTTINRGTVAAAVATVNQITIAPATVASVAGGGSLGGGTISNVAIMSDATYTTVLSGDTAVSTAGGFIRITGTGFRSGANVYLGSTLLTNTFVSSTTINAVVPATSAGSYNLFVMNPDNNGVIGPPVATSGFPTFSQTSYSVASLILNTQLLATGDAPLTYYIQPGSSNPQNLSVSTSGLLTGTLPSDATYTLTVIVDDVQGQSTQATITIIAQTSEPYFNLTTLSLPGDGTNNAQNNTFLDSSSNNFSITRNGNATQGTFTPFSQTGWGLRTCDRNYLTIPASGDFDLINTDFTVEFWVNVNAFNTMQFSGSNFFGNGLATANNGWSMGFAGSGITVTSIEYRTFTAGSQAANNFTGLSFNLGTWNHIVLQRNGSGSNNLRLFVNGVLQGAAQTAVTYSSAGSTFVLGSGSYLQNLTYSGNADYYISNVRLTKSAVYNTSGFTSPTSNLSQISGTTLLICQSNRLINNGTNTGAITPTTLNVIPIAVVAFSPFAPTAAYTAAAVGGSGYFDGTGDFLTLGTSTNLALGAGDFTIDVWLYLTAYNGSLGVIFDWRTAGSTPTNIPLFSISSSGVPAFWQSVSLGAAITGSSAVPLNTWAHLAVVRNGLGSNNLTMYLNGTSIGSATATNSLGIETLRLNDSQGSFGQAGYFSSARIVKGTAVYTANFTPPTSPLTAIANTQLLLNFTNAGITDATAKNVIETVGDAKISTAVSKFGGSSMYFDGTGDNLASPVNVDLNFNTGNFTVEAWVYISSRTLNYPLIVGNNNGSWSAGAIALQNSNNDNASFFDKFCLAVNDLGASPILVASSTNSLNTWYHVAVVRNGTTLTMYRDGTSVASTTISSAAVFNWGKGGLRVGGGNWDGAQSWFNGYIDELRITKGFARYTGNFTPPTAAFSLK